MVYQGSVLCGVAVLGTVAILSRWEGIGYAWAIVLTAVGSVFVGSLRSEPLSVLMRGEEEEIMPISWKEAIKLPVCASLGVCGCYFLVTTRWKAWVQTAALGYFTVIGVICVKFYISSAFQPVLTALFKAQYRSTWKLPCTKPLFIVFSWSDVFTYLLAISLGASYYLTKHWLLNNLFALSFSIYAIESTSVGSFSTGATLLTALCIYDVLWVFGTGVMTTVVKELDIPIKLLFPKVQGDIWTADFALLGLGDVIFPGLIVALAYRLDCFIACKKERKGLPKYFLAGLIGYFVGISGSFLAMWTVNTPQPALLYISPAIAICLFLTAVTNGEAKAIQTYKEE